MREGEVGFLVKKLCEKIQQHGNSLLKEYDLTFSQLKFLLYMFKSDRESFPFKNFEKEFEVSQPTVVGILSRLEKKNYILIIPNKRDLRAKDAILTKKGYDFLYNLDVNISNYEKDLVSVLTEEEHRQLLDMLVRLIDYKS